jgi:hypothetical protein
MALRAAERHERRRPPTAPSTQNPDREGALTGVFNRWAGFPLCSSWQERHHGKDGSLPFGLLPFPVLLHFRSPTGPFTSHRKISNAVGCMHAIT